MGQPFDLDIHIDKSITGGTFTNYDTVQGKVVLKVYTDTTFSNIQVKLEGVSKTMMEVMKEKKDKKPKPIYETHKLLYDTQTVFPTAQERNLSNNKGLAMVPGRYVYPFKFTIPLNNGCSKISAIKNMVQFHHNASNSGIDLINDKNAHIKTILPPSFGGMGDVAQIQYFIKATAKRPSFLRMNIRVVEPFVFLPVDNPKLLKNDNLQAYTRRAFVLKNKYPEIVGVYEQIIPPPRRNNSSPSSPKTPTRRKSSGFLKSMFGGGDETSRRNSSPNIPQGQQDHHHQRRQSQPIRQSMNYSHVRPQDLHVKPIDLKVGFEVRFRYPAYVIPSKLPNYQLLLISEMPPSKFQLFNGESSGLGKIYLRMLKIELVSQTNVYVTSYKNTVVTKETVFYNDRLKMALDLAYCKKSQLTTENGDPMYEIKIPRSTFENAIIPDCFAPSFKTCNIDRNYRLVVTAGFSDSPGYDMAQLVSLDTKIHVLTGMEPILDDYDERDSSDLPSITFPSHTSTQIPDIPNIPEIPPIPELPPLSAEEQQREQLGQQRQQQQEESHMMQDFQVQSTFTINSTPDNSGRLPTYDEVMHNDALYNRRAFEQNPQLYSRFEG
ncbi:unnamed protein product [Ambrosiozyma monospora]|uniref:Unnamed protein product n=1 Tax=Ambrosiozyma monospora TaxID=43982 RepID=A0ACB5T2U3_AMBMO|nr:unnamed protein product [Ambrosiozyma monospora]